MRLPLGTLCAQCACPWSACVAVLSSLRLRSTLVAGCELPRGGESEVLGGGGGGGPAAEVVRVRGLERRDGKDRNGQHGHNV